MSASEVGIHLDTRNLVDYRLFLEIKSLPRYRLRGTMAYVPEEYMSALGLVDTSIATPTSGMPDFLWDYQRDITALALRKRKFSVFADCGLGKTNISLWLMGIPETWTICSPNYSDWEYAQKMLALYYAGALATAPED